jgi:hypothetical protein
MPCVERGSVQREAEERVITGLEKGESQGELMNKYFKVPSPFDFFERASPFWKP